MHHAAEGQQPRVPQGVTGRAMAIAGSACAGSTGNAVADPQDNIGGVSRT
jgi:hypothetical protein